MGLTITLLSLNLVIEVFKWITESLTSSLRWANVL